MTHPLWSMLIAPLLKGLALGGSLAGMALGAFLLARPAATLGWLSRMNRWVSSRRALKALEVPRVAPRPTRQGERRLLLGVVFIAAGAYVLVALLWSFRAEPIATALGGGKGTAIALDAMRWCLVAGSLLTLGVGLMMALWPRTLEHFERWSDRWVSSRRALQGADTMHLPLDRLVEKFPRPAGVLILAVSASGVAASIVLFSR